MIHKMMVINEKILHKKKIFNTLNITFTFIYGVLFMIPVIIYNNKNVPYFPILFYFCNVMIILLMVIFFNAMTCDFRDNAEKFSKVSYYTESIMKFYINKNIILLVLSISSLIYHYPMNRKIFPYVWTIYFIVSESILTLILIYFYKKMISIIYENSTRENNV